MKFIEYVSQKDRIYNEMSRSNKKKGKKAQPVQMPKTGNEPMIIKPDDLAISIGHQTTGFKTGAHAQGEPRKRTRSASKRAAVNDQMW